MKFQKSDGINYAPKGKMCPVVKAGEFVFAATALDHGHIYGMCNGLIEAGAICKWVYDPDPDKVATFKKAFPNVLVANSLDQILNDQEIHMVAAAAIPNKRCDLGVKVLQASKHYFTDKAPLTTLEQLQRAKEAVEKTNKRYMVYYSERLHVESAVLAGKLVADGAIGDVVQVTCLAPHRLSPASRPDWFWDKEASGGILCDLGSHQIEQFLFYTNNTSAEVVSSQIANYTMPEVSGFDDFGCATLVGGNGASQYFRVDWLNPDGLGSWGDGRLFLLGTKGYIEVRKYIDVATSPQGDQLYLVDAQKEQHISVSGTVGYPFFGEMILDCLNGTQKAMTQEHIFKAAELGVIAQNKAERMY